MLGNNTGSADFSNISFRKVFTATGVPKVFPPVGVDEGVKFEGDTKVNTQGVMYFPTGDTSQRGRGRAVFFSGNTAATPAAASLNNTIDYIQIQSQGNAIDFGDMTAEQSQTNTCSSSVRGVFPGRSAGAPSYATNHIEFITFATTGNAQDFGDATDDFSSYQGFMSTGHGGIG